MKLLAIALLLAPALAVASPRPLPFTYPYDTLASGQFEVEQYADLVPVRIARENPDGTLDGVTSMRYVLQTELEYGLTNRLEFGWYFQFRQGADTPFLRFSGVKQRLRYRFAEAGELPIDVGVYLELAEFHDELEFEEKILLAKRLGALNIAANLWVEQEWYFQTGETKYIYNPTIGAAYEITPQFFVGLEYWARGRFDKVENETTEGDAPTKARHYLGPTFLAQRGKVFFSIGAYLRLDGLTESAKVGDPYGKLWIRTLIGIEL